jgi:hypothetical protein
MDRENYPDAEFRIVHKKRQFFASCPFDISSFLSIDDGDSCSSIKILWKYLKKREKWSGVPDYADMPGSLKRTFAARYQISFCSRERRSNTFYLCIRW